MPAARGPPDRDHEPAALASDLQVRGLEPGHPLLAAGLRGAAELRGVAGRGLQAYLGGVGDGDGAAGVEGAWGLPLHCELQHQTGWSREGTDLQSPAGLGDSPELQVHALRQEARELHRESRGRAGPQGPGRRLRRRVEGDPGRCSWGRARGGGRGRSFRPFAARGDPDFAGAELTGRRRLQGPPGGLHTAPAAAGPCHPPVGQGGRGRVH
mmetsp:Transcript_16732/g.42553  ORF Transcript_16732/g.42553 Transcript_16732/m.42553 type:complete len:211 (+) Transcript_16732:2920-3552(+)